MNKETKNIITKIVAGEFSLAASPVYSFKPEVLAIEEYKRCEGLFSRKALLPTNINLFDFEMNIAMLMEKISRTEAPKVEQLKALAVKIITDMYEVPECVVLSPELKTSLKIGDDTEEFPKINLTDKRKEELQGDVQKRLLLNGLVMGASMHIWKSAHHLVKDGIDEIHAGLFTMYEQYTSKIGMYIWMYCDIDAIIEASQIMDTSDGMTQMMTQGYEHLKVEEDGGCEIEAKAINFPVLLHELNKGVLDYLILNGINQDLTEEELAYVFTEADSFEHEIWHQYISPSLWVKLLEDLKVSPQELPEKIQELSLMKCEELTNYLIKIQVNEK